MDAPVRNSPLQEAHRDATDRANAWRGKCVNQFALGEWIICSALAAQSDAKALPMLLSQRITRLSAASQGAPRKQAALDKFRELASLRNAIVHGAGKVYLDAEGRWLLTMRTFDRSGPSAISLSQEQADKNYDDLKKVVQRLSAAFES